MNNKKLLKISGVLFTGLILFVSSPVLAQTLYNPFGSRGIGTIIRDIITFLIDLSIPFSILMGLIAAGHFITSGGNPQKVKKGISALTGAVVGLAVVLTAYSIFGIVQSQIAGASTTRALIYSIVGYLQTLGGPIAIVAFLWGAFLYSTGIPAKIKAAYQIFLWVSIGLAIILTATSIEVFVRYFLT